MPFRYLRGAILLMGLAMPAALQAQGPAAGPTVDSIAVVGNKRLTRGQILTTAALVPHQTINYRDIQRAIANLFETAEFDDVTAEQTTTGDGKLVLLLKVKERPLLRQWVVRGAQKVSEGEIKDRIKLPIGRPLDRAAMARAEGAIDSLYKRNGYYTASVRTEVTPTETGAVRVVFDIDEGTRVALSQVSVEGNKAFPDQQVVGQMATRPEGFWWFRQGRYDEQQLETDTRERLPAFYARHGYLDFQVVRDTLLPEPGTGKAVLQLDVAEGPQYHVGSFTIEGNQRYSEEELRSFYPFLEAPGAAADTSPASRPPFNAAAWQSATADVQDLYANNGYIYAHVVPQEIRRTAPDGTPVVDLKWVIQEGQPATVNKIEIVGNDVTHERVIREQIIMFPGQVFSKRDLIRSYQNISNLGFFQQPMPPPDVNPLPSGDVDIVFRVEEKRTGNVNFGASLGQGTGLGGFIGLAEPNLFGRGKRGQLQWQFGNNIRDFTLSYTDPAIKESRISGTVTLFDSQVRYTISDLGRRQQTGGTLQLGFPFFGARYTRLFGSYGYQRVNYSGGSTDIRQAFNCKNCSRSTIGMTLLRDTRVGLPFATGGTMVNVAGELNGGFLGGTGHYQKIDLEGRWYAPLGSLGSHGQIGAGVQFVLGLTAKSGFIFGDAGPFFTELYSMGGVQFGIPLRGYSEFCVTPNGYDPTCGGNNARASDFGKSYAAFTVEAGARLSQSLYLSTFLDAGNVYRSAREYDPTRLFRGAGVGAALVSPLGPIGVDLAYGFDKVDLQGNPAPGWQVHFKLGNFF